MLFARRCRKYGGTLITGTQSIDDYYKNSGSIAALNNSDWVCLPAQKPEAIVALKNSQKVVMDNTKEKFLDSLKMSSGQYSEIMITNSDGYFIVRLVLDPFSLALYSTKAEDVVKIQELQKNGKSINGKTTKTYVEKLNNIQKQIEESKAKAVLELTKQNVKDYMYLQQKVVNQASYFSDIWRRVLWNTPELDYTQQRPVSDVGKNVWRSERENKITETIKNINKRYGLFFIYSTRCVFCQKYSQILYDLKQQYNIEIKGISIYDKFLTLWQNQSFINNGQLEKLGISYNTVPITVLYDNLTNSSTLVGYGLMTQGKLMRRIYVLTQIKVGKDY